MLERRRLLRSVSAVVVASPLLAACDLLDREPPKPPPPDPLTDFYAQTVALATHYDAVIAATPTLASALTPIRDAHRAHAAALAAIMRPAPSATPSAPASAGSGQTVPLRQTETEAQQSAIKVCLTAPANRATLLGEIAAARACHLEVLPL